uniref:Uncharacterized protein n=1 Tax=Glossina brevipalpis TaxID=37001 RepID=A0A1A9WSA0_9MUSC
MAGYNSARYYGGTTSDNSMMMDTIVVVIMDTITIVVIVVGVGIGVSVATVTGCNIVVIEGIVNRFRRRSFGGIPAAMSWTMRCATFFLKRRRLLKYEPLSNIL